MAQLISILLRISRVHITLKFNNKPVRSFSFAKESECYTYNYSDMCFNFRLYVCTLFFCVVRVVIKKWFCGSCCCHFAIVLTMIMCVAFFVSVTESRVNLQLVSKKQIYNLG